jgi:hypothetical protein
MFHFSPLTLISSGLLLRSLVLSFVMKSAIEPHSEFFISIIVFFSFDVFIPFSLYWCSYFPYTLLPWALEQTMTFILDSLSGSSYNSISLSIFGDLFWSFGPYFLVSLWATLCWRSAYLRKQSPLPVFMDRFHTGKDLQAAYLEIVGAF